MSEQLIEAVDKAGPTETAKLYLWLTTCGESALKAKLPEALFFAATASALYRRAADVDDYVIGAATAVHGARTDGVGEFQATCTSVADSFDAGLLAAIVREVLSAEALVKFWIEHGERAIETLDGAPKDDPDGAA